jgi:hypothetical protein
MLDSVNSLSMRVDVGGAISFMAFASQASNE